MTKKKNLLFNLRLLIETLNDLHIDRVEYERVEASSHNLDANQQITIILA